MWARYGVQAHLSIHSTIMAKRRFTEAGWRKDPWFRALCSALSACKNEEEVAELLRDIGTLSELQAWSERLEVAKLSLFKDRQKASSWRFPEQGEDGIGVAKLFISPISSLLCSVRGRVLSWAHVSL